MQALPLQSWFSSGSQVSAHVPQLFAEGPHARPLQSGVHATQVWAASQFFPAGQVPQLWVPPQPSDAVPQVFPAHAVALGMSGQHEPSAWHLLAAGQDPHEPQPPGSLPQTRPPHVCVQASHTFVAALHLVVPGQPGQV